MCGDRAIAGPPQPSLPATGCQESEDPEPSLGAPPARLFASTKEPRSTCPLRGRGAERCRRGGKVRPGHPLTPQVKGKAARGPARGTGGRTRACTWLPTTPRAWGALLPAVPGIQRRSTTWLSQPTQGLCLHRGPSPPWGRSQYHRDAEPPPVSTSGTHWLTSQNNRLTAPAERVWETETWAACQHALRRKPGCGQDVSALGDRAPT